MELQTYVFSRMPFGLKTAGASFTRAMNTALCDKHFETVIVYLDVLIASETLEEHLEVLENVLERLQVVRFKLNKDKCEFLRTEITFLGHTFIRMKAEINEETKATVRNLIKAARDYPEQVYIREGLHRVRYEEGDEDRVTLPKQATWKVTQQVHRLLLHF